LQTEDAGFRSFRSNLKIDYLMQRGRPFTGFLPFGESRKVRSRYGFEEKRDFVNRCVLLACFVGNGWQV
jgi:hypothetical protein